MTTIAMSKFGIFFTLFIVLMYRVYAENSLNPLFLFCFSVLHKNKIAESNALLSLIVKGVLSYRFALLLQI